jgi:hypothetical protein
MRTPHSQYLIRTLPEAAPRRFARRTIARRNAGTLAALDPGVAMPAESPAPLPRLARRRRRLRRRLLRLGSRFLTARPSSSTPIPRGAGLSVALVSARSPPTSSSAPSSSRTSPPSTALRPPRRHRGGRRRLRPRLLGWATAPHPAALFAATLLTGFAGAATSAARSTHRLPWFVRRRPAALSAAYNGASVGGVALPLWSSSSAPRLAGAAALVARRWFWRSAPSPPASSAHACRDGLLPDGDACRRPAPPARPTPPPLPGPLPGPALAAPGAERPFVTLAAATSLSSSPRSADRAPLLPPRAALGEARRPRRRPRDGLRHRRAEPAWLAPAARRGPRRAARAKRRAPGRGLPSSPRRRGTSVLFSSARPLRPGPGQRDLPPPSSRHRLRPAEPHAPSPSSPLQPACYPSPPPSAAARVGGGGTALSSPPRRPVAAARDVLAGRAARHDPPCCDVSHRPRVAVPPRTPHADARAPTQSPAAPTPRRPAPPRRSPRRAAHHPRRAPQPPLRLPDRLVRHQHRLPTKSAHPEHHPTRPRAELSAAIPPTRASTAPRAPARRERRAPFRLHRHRDLPRARPPSRSPAAAGRDEHVRHSRARRTPSRPSLVPERLHCRSVHGQSAPVSRCRSIIAPGRPVVARPAPPSPRLPISATFAGRDGGTKISARSPSAAAAVATAAPWFPPDAAVTTPPRPAAAAAR